MPKVKFIITPVVRVTVAFGFCANYKLARQFCDFVSSLKVYPFPFSEEMNGWGATGTYSGYVTADNAMKIEAWLKEHRAGRCK